MDLANYNKKYPTKMKQKKGGAQTRRIFMVELVSEPRSGTM